jgi:hypothetical protein
LARKGEFRYVTNKVWSPHSRIIVCAGFLSSISAPPAHAQTLEWLRYSGTTVTDVSYGVSADGLGNVYISDYTEGNLGGPIEGNDADAFLSKYDSAGTLQWIRQALVLLITAVVVAAFFQGMRDQKPAAARCSRLELHSRRGFAVKGKSNASQHADRSVGRLDCCRDDACGGVHYRGGSDVGRLTVSLLFIPIPEPSAVVLLSLVICSSLMVLRARR